ncbi:MAG: hypothetical protein KAT00_11850 [Planctomycetes bacterium]|nr:hypothetical protein [Planctomycetota bacterium]
MGCSDPDMVTYAFYSDLAWDEYLFNENLPGMVRDRYEEVSGWRFGASLAHIPTLALDYLFEATLAHSFGFFRSSIFCCATVLDLELKRSLLEHFPQKATTIEKQTFGQSIYLARTDGIRPSTLERLSRMDEVNRIRNNVSVHPCRLDVLVRHDEIDTPLYSDTEDITQFFQADEIETIQRESTTEGRAIDWLKQLSFKVIWQTKKIIAHGPLNFQGSSAGSN